MERRMQRDERTKEDWSPLDALRDDLQAALPHLQDQGLRELREWCAVRLQTWEDELEEEQDLLLAQSHSGKTIAFRAVIKEIEERIGG